MDVSSNVALRVRFPVDDELLSALHDLAFGRPGPIVPWAERLERHSLTWLGAFQEERLVGFVHAVWDGGAHAFLLDTAVDPVVQRRGIGRALVAGLVAEVERAGCEWLHVDHEAALGDFYRACGFRPTDAGLIRLR
jgi:ribosomal protein S18 acetylase RimI-like enzyme